MRRSTSPLGRPHNFGPVDERGLVFGACRPGFPAKQVSLNDIEAWIDFMRAEEVDRIVCLLASSAEFKIYRRLDGGLLGHYRNVFGEDRVLHAPIRDYRLATSDTLVDTIRFLRESVAAGEKTVIHCAGGSGRTGHVLAAWLVHAYGTDPHEALATVRQTGRNPFESVEATKAKESDLIALLEAVRP